MWNNIGKKLKGLAIVVFIIEALASVITGLLLIEETDAGIILLLAGPLAAWISSWMLFGFGELVDKVTDIERNTRSGERKSETQAKIDSAKIEKLEKLRSQGLITEEEYNDTVKEIGICSYLYSFGISI